MAKPLHSRRVVPKDLHRRFAKRLRVDRDKRGIVAVMYALMVLPLIMVVALAIDYSFYINAQAQLNLAADAAAMHAARVASQYYADNTATVAAAD